MARPISSSGWRTLVSGGVDVPGHDRVVEADQRDVARNAAARRAQRWYRAGGHHVRGGEDGVEIRAPAQQFTHGRASALLREVALRDQVLLDGEPGLPQRLPVAVEPRPRHVHVQRARDGGDGPAAGRQQMPDGEPGAAPVVRADMAEPLPVAAPPGQHGGHGQFLQPVGQGVVAVDRHHEHPVHALGGQIAGEAVALPRVSREDQQQLHPGAGESGGHAPDDAREVRLGEQPVLGVGHDQRHRVRTAGGQGAGHAVGDVTEFRDRPLDGRPGPVADLRGTVDHPGDRAAPDAGAGRHGVQRRAPDVHGVQGRPPDVRGAARLRLFGRAHRSPSGVPWDGCLILAQRLAQPPRGGRWLAGCGH
ncbi:hypothetical protein GCM10017687_16560 [Streptomyces echinatus]